jgi:hypothetical protein
MSEEHNNAPQEKEKRQGARICQKSMHHENAFCAAAFRV